MTHPSYEEGKHKLREYAKKIYPHAHLVEAFVDNQVLLNVARRAGICSKGTKNVIERLLSDDEHGHIVPKIVLKAGVSAGNPAALAFDTAIRGGTVALPAMGLCTLITDAGLFAIVALTWLVPQDDQ